MRYQFPWAEGGRGKRSNLGGENMKGKESAMGAGWLIHHAPKSWFERGFGSLHDSLQCALGDMRLHF